MKVRSLGRGATGSVTVPSVVNKSIVEAKARLGNINLIPYLQGLMFRIPKLECPKVS